MLPDINSLSWRSQYSLLLCTQTVVSTASPHNVEVQWTYFNFWTQASAPGVAQIKSNCQCHCVKQETHGFYLEQITSIGIYILSHFYNSFRIWYRLQADADRKKEKKENGESHLTIVYSYINPILQQVIYLHRNRPPLSEFGLIPRYTNCKPQNENTKRNWILERVTALHAMDSHLMNCVFHEVACKCWKNFFWWYLPSSPQTQSADRKCHS